MGDPLLFLPEDKDGSFSDVVLFPCPCELSVGIPAAALELLSQIPGAPVKTPNPLVNWFEPLAEGNSIMDLL